jgi:hypothetical protein
MRLFVAIVNEACPAPQGPPVYVSTNNGTSWTAASTGLTNNYVLSLAVSPNGVGGTNLFAGTSGGVFLSTSLMRGKGETDSSLALLFLLYDLTRGQKPQRQAYRLPLFSE